MGAPKKSAKGSLAAASPRVVTAAGEPFGRFAEVLAKTRAAGLAVDEFEITEELILYPPTETRMHAMEQTQAAYLLAQASAVSLIRTQGDPPAIPEKGAAPEDPAEWAAFEAAYAERVKAVYEQREAWAQSQQDALRAAYKQCDEAEQAFNEALYGGPDMLQRVEEFFAGRPDWEKKAFAQAVSEQFRRLPHDGRCQACGTVVDQQAGEDAGESSTTSSTTGTSSKGTSPSTSTESTPATGSADSDPGTSSSTTATPLPE